jgi:hypothetical protein
MNKADPNNDIDEPAIVHRQTFDGMAVGIDKAIGKDRTVEVLIPAVERTDQSIVTIDPGPAEPLAWIRAGAFATWVGKKGKQRIPVQVVGWRPNGRRVLVRTVDGHRDYSVPPDRLRKPELHNPVAPGSSAGKSTIVTGRDPMEVSPASVRRVVVRVGGKLRYSGPVTPAAGELLTLLAAHGRKMVVTLHMHDGTKSRYRGNGAQTLGPPGSRWWARGASK